MVRNTVFYLALPVLAACSPGMDVRGQGGVVATFSTHVHEEADIPRQVLEQAAEMTLRRHYTHFLLTKDNNTARRSARLGLNINYGRSPYGFGDAGRTGPEDFSAQLSFSPRRTLWTVHMLSRPDCAQPQAYDARSLLSGK